MNQAKIYLPGLNGIRAIAAIGVVVSHITRRGMDFGLNPYLFGSDNGDTVGWDLAEFGVTMFFALSGFLVTYLLLFEKEQGTISIAKFYARRALRIWPLYYLYILACILVWYLFSISLQSDSFWFYIFFSANVPFILSTTMPFLIHYWSLGVEEQFYFFWPWLVKWSKKKLVRTIIILIVLMVGMKLFLHFFYPNSLLEKIIHVTRFHCMLAGALTATWYYNKNELFIRTTTNKILQLISWVGFGIIALNKFHFASVLDNELCAIITCIIIVGQIESKGIINLENKFFDLVGKWSYGIYVIHPIIIFLFSTFLKNSTPYLFLNYLIVYGAIFGATLLLAGLSYRFYERPFLRLKIRRFTVVQSSNSRSEMN
jgi:peptidoglycan/LPS O-acetylase OafA/YrhL